MRQPSKRARSWWDDGADFYPAEQRSMVVEETGRDDWTGLYDAKGDPIMRERQPFGFRRGD